MVEKKRREFGGGHTLWLCFDLIGSIADINN